MNKGIENKNFNGIFYILNYIKKFNLGSMENPQNKLKGKYIWYYKKKHLKF